MTNQASVSVSYGSCVHGKDENKAVTDALSDPKRIVAGPAVQEFENRVSSVLGKKFGTMVNSGSFANLLYTNSTLQYIVSDSAIF